MTLVFDIETNGLLKETTKIHSLVIYDTEKDELISCAGKGIEIIEDDIKIKYHSIEYGLDLLSKADEIAGHNIVKFDLPAIQKLYPNFKYNGTLFDTMIVAKLAYPDIGEKDAIRVRKGILPKSLYKKHSLKAWGYRLNELKGTYCEEDNCWDTWSRAMQTYCEQDVILTTKLFTLLKSKDIPSQVLSLEHRFARVISLQEQRGIQFNKEKAIELAAILKKKQLDIEAQLREVFPDKEIKTTFIPKVNNKTRGYIKDVPFTKVMIEPFNPSSRQQVVERLREMYDWKPTVFTDAGQPKIDDEVLKSLPYKEAPLLAEYYIYVKLLGYISEGKGAWLKYEKDGVIYGGVDTIGAVTRRCTHKAPNLAQTPNSEAPYGKECRELFEARKGFKLIGCDAKALELRCLAHYMRDEEYTNEILNGDIHTKNQLAAGLPTRNKAKTFIYGFLYGAGDEKVGQLIDKGAKEGKAIKTKFLKNLPSLAKLVTNVKSAIQRRGFLYSVDKYKLKIREEYKGLNALFQSAGAIAMKQALCILFDWCKERGWIKSDYYLLPEDSVYFVLNVHDEYQAEVKEEVVEEYKELAVKAIQEAGNQLGFQCPLDGDVKEGINWYETH